MANPLRSTGARYDVRPAGERFGAVGGAAGISKDALQGAGAGLLALIGATQLTGGEAFIAGGSNIDMLNQLWASLSGTGLTGPAQMLAGVALFLAARRTVSRTAGLLAFIAIAAAYANGMSLPDMAAALSGMLKGAAGALDSIPAVQQASAGA